MRIKRKYIVVLMLCVITAARIIYVNIAYDKPVSIKNEIGETFAYGEQFEIKVNDINAYSKDEWHEEISKMNIQINDVVEDFVTILVEYTVTNKSDKEAQFDRMCVFAQISSAFNGLNMSACSQINGTNDISPTYKPGQTKVIKQVYTLDMQGISDKNILSKKVKVKVCEYSAIHTITN